MKAMTMKLRGQTADSPKMFTFRSTTRGNDVILRNNYAIISKGAILDPKKTSEGCPILCSPGSEKILNTKVKNSKLVFTVRRLRN